MTTVALCVWALSGGPQGRIFSSRAAALITRSSACHGPTICSPIGNPSRLQPTEPTSPDVRRPRGDVADCPLVECLVRGRRCRSSLPGCAPSLRNPCQCQAEHFSRSAETGRSVASTIMRALAKDLRDLARQIGGLAPNTRITVRYLRDGKAQTVSATLGQLREQTAGRPQSPPLLGDDPQTLAARPHQVMEGDRAAAGERQGAARGLRHDLDRDPRQRRHRPARPQCAMIRGLFRGSLSIVDRGGRLPEVVVTPSGI